MESRFFTYEITYWDEEDEKTRYETGILFSESGTHKEAIEKLSSYYGETNLDKVIIQPCEEAPCLETDKIIAFLGLDKEEDEEEEVNA